MNNAQLDEMDFGMNWAADRAMTHAPEPTPEPTPRLKIGTAWGRATAQGAGEYGWIRVRTQDGSCWILRGSDDPAACSNGKLFGVPSIAAKCAEITRHGSIDPNLWIQETGPEPQETTQYAEFLDANDYYG